MTMPTETQAALPTPAPRRTQRWGAAALVVVLCAMAVAPVWLVRYPPLLDYPNHLARAHVILHLHDPAYKFSEFYGTEWDVYPYLTAELLLLGLLRVLPVDAASRVFLSLCALLVPLSAWFFLRQANPGEDAQAVWAALLAHGYFFLLGFVQFELGLAVCFLGLGLWLRWLHRPRAALWLLCGVVFTAGYFTHLVPFCVAGLVVTVYALLARRGLRKLLLSWLMFLPGALCYLRIWWTMGGRSAELQMHDLSERVEGLAAFAHGYSSWLDAATLAGLAAFLVAGKWRNARWRWNTRWAGVTAFLVVAYWVLPWGYGEGGYLYHRLLPVIFVLLLALGRMGSRGWKLAPLALLFFALRTASVTQNFRAAQGPLHALANSFALTPAGARVLPIVNAEEEDIILRPYAHFWAYGVVQRGWYSPYLTATPGFVALRLRYAPYAPTGFWDTEYKEAPDWAQVQRDYDFVWAYDVRQFAPALEAIGQNVYSAGGLVLYRLNKPARAPRPD